MCAKIINDKKLKLINNYKDMNNFYKEYRMKS